MVLRAGLHPTGASETIFFDRQAPHYDDLDTDKNFNV
jgi:hypothetical protein